MDCLQFTTFSWQQSPIQHPITLIDLHPKLEVRNGVSMSRSHESNAHLEAEISPECISNPASIIVISSARLLEVRLHTATCSRKVAPYHSSVKAEPVRILEEGEVVPAFCARVQVGTPWRQIIIKFLSLGEADLCRVYHIAAESSFPSDSPVLSQMQLLMQVPGGSAGDSNAESTVAALHPVQQMALAMAEALAAGKSSQGMSQTKHDQIRSSSHDSLAVASSLTQIVHQMQLDFQTSMANITRALVSMDERMTRAEANLIQMEERITRKLDKIQVQMLPLE